MMKPWFRLALLCWVLVCLLLSLTQATGLNHPSPVVMVRSRARIRVRLVHRIGCPNGISIRFILYLWHLLSSTVLGLRAILLHPAWRPMAHRNRSGRGKLPVKQAAQSNAIEQLSPRNYWPSTAELQNRGFATGFS
jgi:hypothetical protein